MFKKGLKIYFWYLFVTAYCYFISDNWYGISLGLLKEGKNDNYRPNVEFAWVGIVKRFKGIYKNIKEFWAS